jgi:diguanylate cyclase (GGDEF)-like protein
MYLRKRPTGRCRGVMGMRNRIARTLSTLVRPASAAIGRLRYAQKFLLVGLVLLTPLAFTANAYIDVQADQITATVREQDGLRYLRSLIVLTGDLVQARRSAVSRGFEQPLSLESDIRKVDEVDRRTSESLGLHADWAAARRLVLTATESDDQPKSVQFATYKAACDALLAMIVSLGDRSGLIYDPDPDSSYIATALQDWLPSLCDVSGRIADLMELSAQDSGVDQLQVFMDLGKYYGMVSGTRERIAHAADAIAATARDRTVIDSFQSQSRALTAVTAAMGDRLALAVDRRSLREFPSHSADAVRVAVNSFASVAVSALDRLLQARIERSERRIRDIQLWAGVGAILVAYLFAGFYVSVASPVQAIVSVLRAVADGDLSRRVKVRTRDELSFVATVLNDTIATTEAATQRLARQATRDSLTDLPNRSAAIDRLDGAIAAARDTGETVAVLFIDLDRFKAVNDTLGHEAGDNVLRTVSRRLSTVARATDTVARLAGDEFVIICENLGETAAALRVGERVVATVEEAIEITSDGVRHAVAIGASVGVAFVTGGSAISADDLLRDADVAMYRAKQRGRGRVEVFDEDLDSELAHRAQVQQELRRAVDSDELVVFYQPIVDTLRSAVVGFEALARWQHPTRGMVAPDQFIPLAEETGLIVPLGARVLRDACRQAAAWQADLPPGERIRISVNISSVQFAHPTFIATVAGALTDSGLDASNLWLEITETSLPADLDAATATLRALRDLGVHLALDDFGTGYSSLAHLRKFPVEVLKIDRSFVSGLGSNPEDAAIVGMIIDLARTFGHLVIAEGVETQEQVDELNRLGCTLCQGYHLGRPVPAEAAAEALVPRLAAA